MQGERTAVAMAMKNGQQCLPVTRRMNGGKRGRGGGGNERTDGQMDGRTSEGGGSALGFEAFLWFSRVGDLAGESAGQVYGGHYVPTRPLGKSIGRLCIFEWVGINANPSRL